MKEARTDKQGNFIAKVLTRSLWNQSDCKWFQRSGVRCGRCEGAQELVYRFNLEPVGYGNTLPERRRDRDDVKWTLRSTHTTSIFHVDGEEPIVAAVNEAEAKLKKALRWKLLRKLQSKKVQIPDPNPWRVGKLFRKRWLFFVIHGIKLRSLNSSFRSSRTDLFRSNRCWRCS